tara:strand:- start:749 stop:979 length:231 start_codon:yes stop_codon:yes gene_type:complete
MKEKTETFESALKKLEIMVEKLEEGSISLDEALEAFETGIYWSRECNKFLKKAEKRIEIILKNENEEYDQKEFVLE